MIEKNQNYLSYDEIGRIHHIGNEMNYLNFRKIEIDFYGMKQLLDEKSVVPFVVKINPEKTELFNEKKDNANNHLVLLLGIEKQNVLFFDTLLDKKICMSISDFIICYDDVIYFFELSRQEKDFYYISIDNHLKHINDLCINTKLKPKEMIDINNFDMVLFARDAFGIAKVLTERALRYISFMDIYINCNDQIMKELNNKLMLSKKGFIMAEYCHQRRKSLPENFRTIQSKILEMDRSISEMVFRTLKI